MKTRRYVLAAIAAFLFPLTAVAEKLSIVKGSTSQIVDLQIDSTATGGALTGLAYNTGSLVCYYKRKGSAPTVITLATAAVGTFTSSGFVEVHATNMPGLYELGVPNAAFASGVASVTVSCSGAANMKPVAAEFLLTGQDLQGTTFSAIPPDGSLTPIKFGGDGQIAASPTSTTTAVTLAAGESSGTGAYVGQELCIAALKECHPITAWNTSTKVATVSPAFSSAPVAGGDYSVGGWAGGGSNSDILAIKAKTDTIPTWPTNFSLLSVNGSGYTTSTNGGGGSGGDRVDH